MKSFEALARKIETLDELRDVVRTMKVLSSASLRQYETAVAALVEYDRTVELGLHVALRDEPSAPPPARPGKASGRLGVIVFGTDYGMCGRLNHALAEHAMAGMAGYCAPQDRLVMTIGNRVRERLEAAGQPIRECLTTPASADGIVDLVSQLLLRIDDWRARHQVERVWLFYNQHALRAGSHPVTVQLLPIDQARLRHAREMTWPGRTIPTFRMSRAGLLSNLVRQHLFVSLSRACAESLASEHQARLFATQAAERNVDEALEQTNMQYRVLRQQAITAEILDVVSGYEATRLADDAG